MRVERVTMPLANLVEDMQIYPRHKVDDQHVSALVMAMETGVQLPVVVADKKSKRITDGWHRIRAYRKFLGAQAVIDVELRHYANEAAMLLDAVSMNSGHGRSFNAVDKTRIVIMLEGAGVQKAQIAIVLHTPEDYIAKISGRVATAPAPSRDTVTGTDQVALKRPFIHLAGKQLTEGQVKSHGFMPGTSFLLIAKQIATALRENMINLEDHRLIQEFRILRDELDKVIGD